MAVVVSLINMKGGVGKTTLAAQIAHAADEEDLRTLAIDLDPLILLFCEPGRKNIH